MQIQELLKWCNETLQPEKFQDYTPNGLQIEGKEQIQKIMCAVTASEAAIDAAIQEKADVLLVHHGMFWKNEPIALIGWKKRRIKKLLQHDINLVAYHLPLDVHPILGNNVQLAKQFGWQMNVQVDEQNLLALGTLPVASSLEELVKNIAAKLGRTPLVLGDNRKIIQNIAWCTGGAQGFFQAAIDYGVDVFITGEASEAQYHLSQEADVAFVSAGHYATEKFGISALTQALSENLGIPYTVFYESNPI